MENRTKMISFFAALCLFLSAVEYAIPKPLPFLRLGLANLPILLALKKLGWKDLILLMFLKVLGAALISGTLFSYIFLFSFSGSFASLVVLLALRKLPVSAVGLSLASALGNASAQIAVSYFLLFHENTKYIAPILLGTSIVTGIALGIFAGLFMGKSRWYELVVNEKSVAEKDSLAESESHEDKSTVGGEQ